MSGAAFALHTAIEVWAGVNLGFTATLLCGLWRLRKSQRRQAPKNEQPPAASDWPAIAILRPCQGREPGLLENLRSSLTAAYAGPRQVLILVPDDSDPAYAIAQQLIASLASLPDPRLASSVSVLLTQPPPLCNRKVFQLAQAAEHVAAEILVCADSDVRLGDDDLPALLAPLRASASARLGPTGAAFAAPIEVAPQTAWDRASAALVGASTQSFLALYGIYLMLVSWAARSSPKLDPTARQATAPSPMMAGALCALRRSALSQIGGFAAFIDCLGEDNEIARRLCQHGYHIALSPVPARCFDGGRQAGEVIARAARWQTVVRAQRPALWPSYPLMLGATPALLLLTLLWPSPVLCGFVAGLVFLRTLLAHSLLRMQGLPAGPRRGLVSVLRAEGLLWLGFIRSAGSRCITWRGHRFRIDRGGRLRPADRTL